MPPAPRLFGRAGELETLGQLLANVRSGQSAVLVMRGEPGIGKTELLRHLIGQASGFRVARAVGVESEMELPFAGLHQLCAPMLGRFGALAEPQRHALSVAFGLASGDSPDRFMVALGALSLMAEASEEQPLLCVVDDAQWLDQASAQVLGFVGRRLLAESIALVFAARPSPRAATSPDHLAGLPELRLGGLDDEAARALLATVTSGPLDEGVRARIVAETHGNPLALLELCRGLGTAELAGGFALPDAGDLPRRIEHQYVARLDELPDEAQRLVLLVAADPVGDLALVLRAAQALGLDVRAIDFAAAAGLLDIGANVRFRHPLIRSAVYRAAAAADRRAAHDALAAVTDPEADPDRRAWHRAHAMAGPDEAVAGELISSAVRALRRGGVAAAAAFWERAVALTPDPGQRASRALAAADAKYAAGDFEAAQALLVTAEVGPLTELGAARMQRMRAQIAFALRREGRRLLVAGGVHLDGAEHEEGLGAAAGIAQRGEQAQRLGREHAGPLQPGAVARQPAQEEQHLGEDELITGCPRLGQDLLGERAGPRGVAGEHRRVGQAEQRRRGTAPVGRGPRQRQRGLMSLRRVGVPVQRAGQQALGIQRRGLVRRVPLLAGQGRRLLAVRRGLVECGLVHRQPGRPDQPVDLRDRCRRAGAARQSERPGVPAPALAEVAWPTGWPRSAAPSTSGHSPGTEPS